MQKINVTAKANEFRIRLTQIQRTHHRHRERRVHPVHRIRVILTIPIGILTPLTRPTHHRHHTHHIQNPEVTPATAIRRINGTDTDVASTNADDRRRSHLIHRTRHHRMMMAIMNQADM